MGEPLRKLEIDGGDFERNNEDTFTQRSASPRHRPFRTPPMSLTIPT